jgi:hypothetical protein
MGLFRASDGSNPSDMGDVYGDVYGDLNQKAQVRLHDTMKPLMGSPLPLSLFGGLAKLFKFGDSTSKAKLANMVTSAGAVPNATGRMSATDPAMANAVQSVVAGAPTEVSHIDGPNISLADMGSLLSLLTSSQNSGENGDSYAKVRNEYGDVIADQWRSGNVPGMMHDVLSLAGEPIPTTGDSELDSAIVGDVLDDESFSYGDPEKDINAEMGGLFTRAKINHAIKKGNRRKRKNKKREAKQQRKADLDQSLLDAKQYANDQTMTPANIQDIVNQPTPGMTNDFPNMPGDANLFDGSNYDLSMFDTPL